MRKPVASFSRFATWGNGLRTHPLPSVGTPFSLIADNVSDTSRLMRKDIFEHETNSSLMPCRRVMTPCLSTVPVKAAPSSRSRPCSKTRATAGCAEPTVSATDTTPGAVGFVRPGSIASGLLTRNVTSPLYTSRKSPQLHAPVMGPVPPSRRRFPAESRGKRCLVGLSTKVPP